MLKVNAHRTLEYKPHFECGLFFINIAWRQYKDAERAVVVGGCTHGGGGGGMHAAAELSVPPAAEYFEVVF